MTLPKNLTKEHLLKAIEKIDKEGVPSGADSQYYDVVYNQRYYPPKLIVSYANIFANGEALDRSTFAGGLNTECFDLLSENDFTIVPKENVLPLISSFLDRVHKDPNNLKTSEFKGEFSDLKVEVSFGQGNQATIPWIAFLADGQKVSHGIYPVFLYYKSQNILILAYGLSETNPPLINWNITTPTIHDFFKRSNREPPKRYGDSILYSMYPIDVNKDNYGIDKATLNKDIRNLISEYKKIMATSKKAVKSTSSPTRKISQKTFDLQVFKKALKDANLQFPDTITQRFVSALAAKPFVIMTGLSGSGKTKLAQAFAKWIIEEPNQVCLVPVGADWTNREPLLGFPNMQQSKTYILPDNGALSLVLSAAKDPQRPYFLILDEMNLSHVERYFADFLSCMESGEFLKLHPGDDEWNVPPAVKLPSNLFIIGTVNIDETTYMFSPKVLDRASVIEFRVSSKDMTDFLENSNVSNLSQLQYKGASMAESFVEIARSEKVRDQSEAPLYEELVKFHITLELAGAEFGYRTASEILAFTRVAAKLATWEEHQIIDAIIMQKLLPRLHGSRRRLESILRTLAGYCLIDDSKVDQYLQPASKFINLDEDKSVKYKTSLKKLQRMYSSLISNSFTSYAEA